VPDRSGPRRSGHFARRPDVHPLDDADDDQVIAGAAPESGPGAMRTAAPSAVGSYFLPDNGSALQEQQSRNSGRDQAVTVPQRRLGSRPVECRLSPLGLGRRLG
jgi:hypothetical protein